MQLITRSIVPFRLAMRRCISASRFLNRNWVNDYDLRVNRHISNGRRSFTSTPRLFFMNSDKYDFVIKMLDDNPGLPSVSTSLEIAPNFEAISFEINIPGFEKMKETEEGLCVFLNTHGINEKNVQACVKDNNLLIQGKTQYTQEFFTAICLPENVDKARGFNREMKDGILKVILPKVMNKELETNERDVVDCRDLTNNPPGVHDSLPLSRIPLLALPTWIRTFTVYMDETSDRFRSNVTLPGLDVIDVFLNNTPGLYKMKETDQEAYVSLNMPGLDEENVGSSVKFHTLEIAGQKENEYYFTVIELPENVDKTCDMKREIKDGMYKVTIPLVKK